MQFSGQDCVKTKRKADNIRSSLVLLLNSHHQINVGPTNLSIDVIIFNTFIESLLPFVGFTSSQCDCCA